MKRLLLALSILSIVLIACNKENENAVPKCIQEQLAVFESNQACSEGATVKSYTFQGKVVYLFDPGYCGSDLSTEVYADDCNFLGFLGGVTGNVMINGVDFYMNSQVKGSVWSN